MSNRTARNGSGEGSNWEKPGLPLVKMEAFILVEVGEFVKQECWDGVCGAERARGRRELEWDGGGHPGSSKTRGHCGAPGEGQGGCWNSERTQRARAHSRHRPALSAPFPLYCFPYGDGLRRFPEGKLYHNQLTPESLRKRVTSERDEVPRASVCPTESLPIASCCPKDCSCLGCLPGASCPRSLLYQRQKRPSRRLGAHVFSAKWVKGRAEWADRAGGVASVPPAPTEQLRGASRLTLTRSL